MTRPTNHFDDELLSALVDDQLSPDETARVREHVASCAECQEQLEGIQSVAGLLRRLPDEEPPRDFALSLRLVADPPSVIRLRRWYTATRVAAASLAAVFVLLSAGTLYIDARPGATSAPAAEASRPQVVSAPSAASTSGGAPPAARAAQPAALQASPTTAAPALAPAPGVAAARPAAPGQADDQVAAAATVRALPTPPPTPTSAAQAARPAVDVSFAAPTSTDPAAPVRTGAAVVGVLAVLSLLATLVVRHRLQHQAYHL